MSWSMWGGSRGRTAHNQPAPAPERRSAWFHGRYRGPVWGVTAAMAASLYLRYFNGPSFEAKGTLAQMITMAIPVAIVLVSIGFAFSIYKGPRMSGDSGSHSPATGN